MCFLYAVYAVDVVATAIAASALADTLDTMEQLGDSIHAVSDAMTQLLGTSLPSARSRPPIRQRDAPSTTSRS